MWGDGCQRVPQGVGPCTTACRPRAAPNHQGVLSWSSREVGHPPHRHRVAAFPEAQMPPIQASKPQIP